MAEGTERRPASSLSDLGANTREGPARPLVWLRASVCAIVVIPVVRQTLLAFQGFADWVKHDPVFTLFVPVVLPAAFRVAVRTHVRITSLKMQQFERRLSNATLAVLLLCGVYVAYVSGTRPPVEPYQLRSSGAALEADRGHRAALKDLRVSVYLGTTEDARKAAEHQLDTEASARSSRYNREFPPFSGLSDAMSRGSLVAWLTGVSNMAAALLVAWLVWQFCLAAYARLNRRLPADELAALVNDYMLVIALLVMWFPLRLYKEWYSGLYSFDNLAHFQAAIVLLVVFAVSVYLLLVGHHGKTVPVLGAISTLVGIAFGTASQVAPWFLWWCERMLSNVSLALWIVVAIVLGIAIAVTTIRPTRPAHS